MKNSVYIRKNMISKEDLKEIIENIFLEKEKLERDFNDDFSFRYILVKYKDREVYFDKETARIFPIFNESNFKKYKLDTCNFDIIIDELNKEFYNFNEWELINEGELRKCFYQENKRDLISKGKILSKTEEIGEFIVIKNFELHCFNEKMEEIEEGYAIPVIRVGSAPKDLFELINLWEEKNISPIFMKEKQKEKYLKLLSIYEKIERYNVKDKKIIEINKEEVFKDLENKEYIYSLEKVKDTLLNIDKIRVNIDKYDEGLLLDSQRGHWDLYYYNDSNDIKNREMIEIEAKEKIYSRDPRMDIKYSGVVAIDFGTKSTVVACQKDNDRSFLIKVGGGTYKDYKEINKYENPTVMEFIDIIGFLEDYESTSGRPYTKWEDLKISHTAVSDFIAGSNSIIEGLKQWCGNKNEKIIIYDKKGEKIYLPPYLEFDENSIDPIEIYAYYIGSYINNMHTGDIFLNYILSFPITYDKQIREKIMFSFTRGLKKSLPISILDDKDIMENFSVINGTSEPTAYALCALKEFDIFPKLTDEKIYYGVFDFGGGTTDFTFGICKKIDSKRYDYEIKHFGESGLKYLGGENILRILSFEVFKDNIEKMINENIPIFCPKGSSEQFPGYENVIVPSYEAKFNMKQLCEKLRPLWEETEEMEEKDIFKVTLLRKNGERVEGIELTYDEDKLKNIIEALLLDGINNFVNTLRTVCENNELMEELKNINIFLSGNSSKSLIFQKLFKLKLEELEKEIKLEEEEKIFNVFLPLGSKENFKLQKENIYEEMLNGKTGTAYGLLETREGSRIKLIQVDEIKNNSEINFKYYVGYSINGKLKVFLNYKNGYNNWIELLDAGERKTDIYYSDKQNANEGNLLTSDTSVKRKSIIIDNINENANIYIRIKDSETIEYVVAYADKIKEEEYLEKIKELKL